MMSQFLPRQKNYAEETLWDLDLKYWAKPKDALQWRKYFQKLLMEGKGKNLVGEKKFGGTWGRIWGWFHSQTPAPHLPRHIKKYERSNASPNEKTILFLGMENMSFAQKKKDQPADLFLEWLVRWRWPESQGSASEQVRVIVAIDRLIEAPAYNQIQTFGAKDFMLC